MSYQISSDIHLEFYKNVDNIHKYFTKIIEVNAQYLILAGDIGNPKEDIYWTFMNWCSENFEKIFVITGNHEYYNNDIEEVDGFLYKEFEKYENIFFLQCDKIENENTIILGCTLWSRKSHEKVYRSYVRNFINDYRKIKKGNNLLSLNDTHNIFTNHFEWLCEEIRSIPKDKDIIIITHHLPTYKLINKKYLGKVIDTNSAFASGLDILFEFTNIKLWVCGHTHSSADKVFNQTRVCINPCGYPILSSLLHFNNDFNDFNNNDIEFENKEYKNNKIVL